MRRHYLFLSIVSQLKICMQLEVCCLPLELKRNVKIERV